MSAPPIPPPLAVLYEDPHLIAVAKPAGILTQGFHSGEPTLEDLVRRHLSGGLDDEDAIPPFLGTVHRLDRPVSGVVVWAKTTKAARRLSAQFASRTTRKEYWGVSGATHSPEEEREGTWRDWLTSTTDASGVVRIVEPSTPGSNEAVTRFQLDRSLEASEGVVLLKLHPETGRTHQLRAQASARGLPFLGDLAYGSSLPFEPGVALHAFRLTLEHPVTRERLSIAVKPPVGWGRLVDRFDASLG